MRRVLLAILLLAPLRGVIAQQLVVGVDQRVELLSLVFRLAGAPEYSEGSIRGYPEAADRHFAAHREHEVVRMARALRADHGVSFDAVMSMAVHLSPFPALGERTPFDSAGSTLDPRWPPAKARLFAEALRRFARDADVAGFFAAQHVVTDSANARLRRMVAERVDPSWFERFFATPGGERFVLVPGLLNGGGSFGPSVSPREGSTELWAIIGTWNSDSAGLPVFPEALGSTIAHEFAHSFINKVVARHRSAYEGFAPTYDQVATVMRAQSYGNWKTVVDESLVRATTVAWARANLSDSLATVVMNGERSRGFVWTGELADSLAVWRARRAGRPWLDDGSAEVGAWFGSLTSRVVAMNAAFDALRPRIVSSSIASGATNVDPATTTFTVTFDRPMVVGWNVGGAGDAKRPQFAQPGFSPDRRTWTVRITLEPATDYGFSLNGPLGGGFRTPEGVALARTEVRFRTR